VADALVRVSLSPGDNYVVAVSCDEAERDGFGTSNAAIAAIDEAQRTEMLTIWRALHIEVDSMGNSSAQGHPDDQAIGDVPDPDLWLYDDAFFPAYISVRRDTGHDDPQTPFIHHHPNDANERDYAIPQNDPDGGENGSRGENHRKWWVVYVVGAYEYWAQGYDNDGPLECGIVGVNHPGLDEGVTGEAAFVFEETVRDVADQWGLLTADIQTWVALHEVGHQFTIGHSDVGVMWAPTCEENPPFDEDEASIPDAGTTFAEEHIEAIRDQGRREPRFP